MIANLPAMLVEELSSLLATYSAPAMVEPIDLACHDRTPKIAVGVSRIAHADFSLSNRAPATGPMGYFALAAAGRRPVHFFVLGFACYNLFEQRREGWPY